MSASRLGWPVAVLRAAAVAAYVLGYAVSIATCRGPGQGPGRTSPRMEGRGLGGRLPSPGVSAKGVLLYERPRSPAAATSHVQLKAPRRRAGLVVRTTRDQPVPDRCSSARVG